MKKFYRPKQLFMLQKSSASLETVHFNFGYSVKNIGIPQNKTHLLQLIEKIEMVIKTMRCRVLCNGKKETNGIKAEWYKLKSSKRLKQVKKLIPFILILLR